MDKAQWNVVRIPGDISEAKAQLENYTSMENGLAESVAGVTFEVQLHYYTDVKLAGEWKLVPGANPEPTSHAAFEIWAVERSNRRMENKTRITQTWIIPGDDFVFLAINVGEVGGLNLFTDLVKKGVAASTGATLREMFLTHRLSAFL